MKAVAPKVWGVGKGTLDAVAPQGGGGGLQSLHSRYSGTTAALPHALGCHCVHE